MYSKTKLKREHTHTHTHAHTTFFFFKQKTAYEMLRSLVGSEMCIRDSD